MNLKTLLVDTGANINAFASPQDGMHARCTATGSGFIKGVEYQYDATATKWRPVHGPGYGVALGVIDVLSGNGGSFVTTGGAGWATAPTNMANATDGDDTTAWTPGVVNASTSAGAINAAFALFTVAEPNSTPVYIRIKVGIWMSQGSGTATAYIAYSNTTATNGGVTTSPMNVMQVATTTSTTEVVSTTTWTLAGYGSGSATYINVIQNSSAGILQSNVNGGAWTANWGVCLTGYNGASTPQASMKLYSVELYAWGR